VSEDLSLFEAGILAAVYRGVNTLGALKEMFNTVDPKVVEATVLKLESKGLISRKQKGFLRKRTVYILTQRGVDALDQALKMLREASEAAKSKIEAAGASRGIDDYAPLLGAELFSILPLLLFLGFLPPLVLEDYGEPMAGEYYDESDTDFGDSLDVDLGE